MRRRHDRALDAIRKSLFPGWIARSEGARTVSRIESEAVRDIRAAQVRMCIGVYRRAWQRLYFAADRVHDARS